MAEVVMWDFCGLWVHYYHVKIVIKLFILTVHWRMRRIIRTIRAKGTV